jgi:3-oxoacyl-[acyl-carrier protein] reductase
MRGRTIVVVGGSRGIGLGITERCAALGAQVWTVSRSPGQLAILEQTAAESIKHLALDVTQGVLSPEQLPPTIDGFVYAPGSIHLGMLRSLDVQQLREDFELNVVGAVRCLQAALPGLKASGAGSALFFSTVAVAQGLPMHSSVAAAKAAIEALVRTWAAELSPTIRVNAIAPALTDTPLAEKFLSTEEKRKAMDARYPLGRVGQIDDMVAAAEFLLSVRSSWITGQVLHVDGGLSTVRK